MTDWCYRDPFAGHARRGQRLTIRIVPRDESPFSLRGLACHDVLETAMAVRPSADPGRSLTSGSEIRDRAGMFSEEAVRQAKTDLDRLEQATRVTTLIETVDSLNGQTIANASLKRPGVGINGIYVLISKADHKLEARDSKKFLGEPGRRSIVDAITSGFKAGNFDEGLTQGVQAIESAVADSGGLPAGGAAVPPGPVRGRGRALPGRVPPGPNPGGGSSGLSILVMIGVVILAVMIGMRHARQPLRRRPRSSGRSLPKWAVAVTAHQATVAVVAAAGSSPKVLLGGLGGGVGLGNWLYDQFGNRHSGGSPPTIAASTSGDAGGGGDWGGTSGDSGR